ncbi:hypothetical protein NY10_1789 [Carnobacterium antarcticum]|nr:hypothetical protein NY10_1789 [Carnobacterium sp. CP1]
MVALTLSESNIAQEVADKQIATEVGTVEVKREKKKAIT